MAAKTRRPNIPPSGGSDTQYRSLTQIIVDLLRERIVSGEFPPGSRLIISDLANLFNASPVPVREALRNLETEGLVEFRLNRGVVVRELSMDEVRELFLIRRPLEALAAVEATRWATQDEIEALRELLVEMDGKVAGSAEWQTLHYRFHEEFYKLSRLPRLIRLLQVLRSQMRPYSNRYLYDSDQGLLAKIQKEHYAMLNALAKRDTDMMRLIIDEHLARPARLAMRALGPDGEEDSMLEGGTSGKLDV